MSLIPTLVILFIVAGVVMYFGMIYNGLIAMRNDIDKSWANIDVLLKQRHDEVPRLVWTSAKATCNMSAKPYKC
jgi:LemA protein